MFHQDFDLFAQSQSRAAPSLDLTPPPSFNPVSLGVPHPTHKTNASLNSPTAHTSTISSPLRTLTRPAQARPPVPLFHQSSNTIGTPQQHLIDLTSATMGAREINVAYDGTFGDLAGAGDLSLFGSAHDDFDFTQYLDGAGDMVASDSFSAINATTVSPKDLFADSVPPSTAFTNLTTPGSTFLETPDDDYQTSPALFTQDARADNWFSLFPDQDTSAAAGADMVRTTSASSACQIMVHPGGESKTRKRSSANTSPVGFNSPAVRHSSVAGVSSRKRDKPLPPIMVDETDAVALKRARNTAAARKSRAKKVEERDGLEVKIAALEARCAFWKEKALAHGAPDEEDED